MTKNNPSNLDVTNNADGFDVSGGTTKRKVSVSGGDVSMVGGGGVQINFPTVAGTLATLNGTEELKNKTITGAIGVSPLLNEPAITLMTDYPASGKFNAATVNTGSVTFTAAGMTLSTGASATSSQRNLWIFMDDNAGYNIFSGNPRFSTAIYLNSVATLTGSWYGGLGNIVVSGTGHTFTNAHIGFKFATSGGVTTLYATSADNTTETATALTTVVKDDILFLRFIVTGGGANIAFYYNKNFAGWSTATNITTNIPSGAGLSPYIQQSVSNNSTANTFSVISSFASITY